MYNDEYYNNGETFSKKNRKERVTTELITMAHYYDEHTTIYRANVQVNHNKAAGESSSSSLVSSPHICRRQASSRACFNNSNLLPLSEMSVRGNDKTLHGYLDNVVPSKDQQQQQQVCDGMDISKLSCRSVFDRKTEGKLNIQSVSDAKKSSSFSVKAAKNSKVKSCISVNSSFLRRITSRNIAFNNRKIALSGPGVGLGKRVKASSAAKIRTANCSLVPKRKGRLFQKKYQTHDSIFTK